MPKNKQLNTMSSIDLEFRGSKRSVRVDSSQFGFENSTKTPLNNNKNNQSPDDCGTKKVKSNFGKGKSVFKPSGHLNIGRVIFSY